MNRNQFAKRALAALMIAVAIPATTCGGSNDDGNSKPQAPVHSWQSIQYRRLPCHWATQTMRPSLGISTGEVRNALELQLEFHMPANDVLEKEEFVFPEVTKIQARLHYSDGTIIRAIEGPTGDFEMLGFLGGLRGKTGTATCLFPWGPNDFSEAWIELQIPGATYWLSVPYGFTRDPASALCDSEVKGGPRPAPSLLKARPDLREILYCDYVEYSLPGPQTGWKTTLRLQNPADAQCEVVLYRDDFRGWDLFTPRTSVFIRQLEHNSPVGRCWKIEDHGDRLRRSDYFKFNRNGGAHETRCWGSIVVKIDDFDAETVIPSSLFNYFHGVADRATLAPNR